MQFQRFNGKINGINQLLVQRSYVEGIWQGSVY